MLSGDLVPQVSGTKPAQSPPAPTSDGPVTHPELASILDLLSYLYLHRT